MRSLAELQQRFAGELRSRDVASTAAAAGGIAGIDVYRNTIRVNYRSALRATYPVVCALTAVPFFHAAVDAFADAHPSRSGDLNAYGDAFGNFLARYPHARELPYLADVARLEWAIDEAQRAADPVASPTDPLAALAATPPDRLARVTFGLHPSCRLLRSVHPALRIWQVHQPEFSGEPDVPFGGPPEHLLVRPEAGVATIERLGAGEFAWLAVLWHGDTLGHALDAAFAADPGFAFERTLRDRIADCTLATLRAH